MLPGMELMACGELGVPIQVMHHVVAVESSFNPYAIGVVGGRLVRQPRSLPEALATAKMLERQGRNFSLGLAQVNRKNLGAYGLDTHAKAFDACPNLRAGARILAECHQRAGGDWAKAFSCYYSGNFVTGFRHGYVQKVIASMRATVAIPSPALTIALADDRPAVRVEGRETAPPDSLLLRRRGQGAGPGSGWTATPERSVQAPGPRLATAMDLLTDSPAAFPGGSPPSQRAAPAPSVAEVKESAGDVAFVF